MCADTVGLSQSGAQQDIETRKSFYHLLVVTCFTNLHNKYFDVAVYQSIELCIITYFWQSKMFF